MSSRILICIPCLNRRAILEQCVPTVYAAKRPFDDVRLCNDGSTEYDDLWLAEKFGSAGSSQDIKGIEAWRRNNLEVFWHWRDTYTHIYFSDCDALHDPTAFNELLCLQAKYDGAPICGYNTPAHANMVGNTIKDDPASGVIWRRYAPGISYLLSKEHIAALMPRLNSITNFDWQIPDILGNRFAVTRTSYVDHIGKFGLHDPGDYEGYDEGDRATNPTPWLVQKRAEVVAKLQGAGK